MTVEQIKSLPRTEEGLFDLSGLSDNFYKAALAVYPVYAAYETTENKKEGYPDIMAQMRQWNKKINGEFNLENGAYYTAMLYATIENMSPEIYENYRELLDMLRAMVKKFLGAYYVEEAEAFAEEVRGSRELALFCETVQKACGAYLLLAEKYQMCF